MASEQEFSAAQVRVKQLSRTSASDELLELYAYFKQATLGDAQGSRPGMLDFKGRAKFDAWSARQGRAKDRASGAYVDLVAKLVTEYGSARCASRAAAPSPRRRAPRRLRPPRTRRASLHQPLCPRPWP